MSERSRAGNISRLFVLGCFGWLSVTPAHALPEMGPAFATDPPVPVLTDTYAFDLRIASDGERVFSVFEEGGNIRGMLVDAMGEPLLDQMAVYAAATEMNGNYYPALAYGGGEYLVLWSGSGIWAQRVDTEGVAKGEPLLLSEDGYNPGVVWLQDKFVIVWLDFDDGGTAQLALSTLVPSTLASEGTPSERRFITTEGASQPTIAASQSGALVTWATNSDSMNTGVAGLLIDGAGEPSSEVLQIVSITGSSPPEVASDGTNYLVAWAESTLVSAAVVSATGDVGSPVNVAEGGSYGPVSLGVNAAGYTVVWKDYAPELSDELYQRSVSAAGELGPSGLLTGYSTTANARPALLGQGAGYWVAYQGDDGVYGVRADGALAHQGESIGLSLVASNQNTPYQAFDGTNYLLVWADEREGDAIFSARAVRIDQAGRVLDAEPLLLNDPATRGSWFSVASRGEGSTLVGWYGSDTGDTYFRTVSSEGELGPLVQSGTSGTGGGPSIVTQPEGYRSVYPGPSGQFLLRDFDAAGAPKGEPTPLELPEGTLEARLLGDATSALLVLYGNAGDNIGELGHDGTLGTLYPVPADRSVQEVVTGVGRVVVVSSTDAGGRVGHFWGLDGYEGQEFEISTDGRWGKTAFNGVAGFSAVFQDSEYFGHYAEFGVRGSVGAGEPLFADEECNGPSIVSNGAGQFLLSCIRYNTDYSRRLVNYLMGAPLPDAEPPVAEPADDSAPNATDADRGSDGGVAQPSDTIATEAPAASTTAPGIEPESTDATSVGSDSEPASTNGAAPKPSSQQSAEVTATDGGSGQNVVEADEGSDDSGCQLGAGRASGRANSGALFGLAFALAAWRLRRGASAATSI